MRKLNALLAPPAENMRPDWRVGDVLGTWWRCVAGWRGAATHRTVALLTHPCQARPAGSVTWGAALQRSRCA